MEKEIRIKKRDGRMELHNAEKYHQHVFDAAEGLKNVSVSEIEMHAALSITDGVESKDIQAALIKSAADKISVEEPEYEIVAARLLNQDIRKEVYGRYSALPFSDMINKNIEDGIYDGEYLFSHYTNKDIEYFGNYIKYDRDDKFVYSGLKKTKDSYLTKQYGELRETPQEMFMLINLFAFAKYQGQERIKWVKEGYNILSNFEASLPTPIMIQLRTAFKRYISCNLIHPGDSNDTLAGAAKMIMNLVANGAGLGIANTVRGEGADIDNGRIEHTGVLPIYKGFEKNTKAFVQPSRDGSSTIYHPFFHSEVESMMVWGNAKGTEETRIREMDHAITFTTLFFERLKADEDITLFYMNDVKDLSNYMGQPEEFKRRYEIAERNIPKDRQTKIKASKIANIFLDQRFLQSREYTAFLDIIGEHGMYNVPIIMSNLCTEITQPVFPIRGISIRRNINFISEDARAEFYRLRTQAYFHSDNDKKLAQFQEKMSHLYEFTFDNITHGVDESKDYDYFDINGLVNLSEVGVCILGGINMGHTTDKRMSIVSEYLVRFLEELIDYMDYTNPEVEKAAKMRRTLGIGFSDVFHLMAKNQKFYNTREGRQFLSNRIELCAFHMTRTSIELAEERGACKLITDTKYNDGLFPGDVYKKSVDELIGENKEFDLDWEKLRLRMKKSGMRHSTLMANAPFGSSSMVSNSTPGLEPPRDLANTKKGVTKLVPDIQRYGKLYTTTWGVDFNNVDYFKFLAVAQKWMDQTISVNQYHNLVASGGKIKKSRLMEEFLAARYYGLKTLYYSNIRSNDKEDGDKEEQPEACGSGGCEV